MKMDDAFEADMICDIFYAHLQLARRYISIAHINLLNFFVMAPGETIQSKILKPAPFMFIMFLMIVVTISIQSNKYLRSYLCNLHAALTPGIGHFSDESVLSKLVNNNNNEGNQITQHIKEGLVGVYAMQGRRGNMEDRFSVMQDVVVGPNKKMSFIGVYDGHGGQYVAEYLRTNLFKNTVEKIKQLRNSVTPTPNGVVKPKTSTVSNGTPTGGRKSSLIGRCDSTESNSESESSTAGNSLRKRLLKVAGFGADDTCASDDKAKDAVKEQQQQVKSADVDQKGSDTPSSSASEKDMSDTRNNADAAPLKKDDAYNTLNIRKKSLASIGSLKENKEESTNDDNQYVDLNKNINYTRLLTDQILNIDSQVVEQCKSNSDLSGSTAVVALLDGELLVVGNVGDSRAVMADDKGRAVPLSFDHKPNQLKERRRIKQAGGFITFTGVWRVAGILATSRALGDFPLKHPRPLVTAEPDILTFSLIDHKAEFVILATDGLWDVVSNEEAVSYVRARLHEPDFGAKSMALHAYHLGSQDNITVAVINFSKLNGGVR